MERDQFRKTDTQDLKCILKFHIVIVVIGKYYRVYEMLQIGLSIEKGYKSQKGIIS